MQTNQLKFQNKATRQYYIQDYSNHTTQRSTYRNYWYTLNNQLGRQRDCFQTYQQNKLFYVQIFKELRSCRASFF